MNDPVEINVSSDGMTVDEVDAVLLHGGARGTSSGCCAHDSAGESPSWRSSSPIPSTAPASSPSDCSPPASSARRSTATSCSKARAGHGAFRKHQIPVLVATDLAARGIDVQQISHIVNYDMPQDSRSTSTASAGPPAWARAARPSPSSTREQGEELTEIEMLINKQISKLEMEGFSPTPPPRQSMDRPAGPPRDAAPLLPPAGAMPATPPRAPPPGPTLAVNPALAHRRRRLASRCG